MMPGAVCDCLFKQLDMLNNSLNSSMLFSRHSFMRDSKGKATKKQKLINFLAQTAGVSCPGPSLQPCGSVWLRARMAGLLSWPHPHCLGDL